MKTQRDYAIRLDETTTVEQVKTLYAEYDKTLRTVISQVEALRYEISTKAARLGELEDNWPAASSNRAIFSSDLEGAFETQAGRLALRDLT